MRTTVLVAVGGASGAAMRWTVGSWMPTTGGFPWATLVVNIVGCVLIGLAARRMERGSAAWFGVVTGVLGGLTTFSAFAAETRVLVADGRPAPAAAYVVATVAGGLLAVELARGRRVTDTPHRAVT